jgi:hypothetical protein
MMMNQHHYEARRIPARLSDILAVGWRGYCECGWVGPDRDHKHDAEDDGSAHHLAEIPDDAEGSIYA